MNIVVDTNIIFSGLLSPKGTFSDILLNSTNIFDFYAPSYLLEELEKHQKKLLTLSGFSVKELTFLKNSVYKKMDFIDLESIRQFTWEKAIELTKNVDEFDAPFVALSLELDSPLWTGDKKLLKGLEIEGVNWVRSTDMMLKIRDGLL